MKHLLAVAIMAAFSMTAVAWVDGGEDFADRSEKYESKSRKNDYSRGYFQGLVGGVAFATSQPNNGTLAICYPEQSTLSQLITITRNTEASLDKIENTPAILHVTPVLQASACIGKLSPNLISADAIIIM